jgi:hypothetical protein
MTKIMICKVNWPTLVKALADSPLTAAEVQPILAAIGITQFSSVDVPRTAKPQLDQVTPCLDSTAISSLDQPGNQEVRGFP